VPVHHGAQAVEVARPPDGHQDGAGDAEQHVQDDVAEAELGQQRLAAEDHREFAECELGHLPDDAECAGEDDDEDEPEVLGILDAVVLGFDHPDEGVADPATTAPDTPCAI